MQLGMIGLGRMGANLVRRLAALYPQQNISAATIETELAQSDAAPMPKGEISGELTLGAMVERYLQRYFASYGPQMQLRRLISR